MKDEVVLVYKDVVLRKSDLDLLEGTCYLNDRILEFYFSYLSSLYQSRDILLVSPAISFWLANCSDSESFKECVEPLKLLTKQLIIFTVNNNDDVTAHDGGTHWSLLVYYRNSNTFVHYDSMAGLNREDAMKLYEAVKRFAGSEASSSMLTSLLKGRKKKKKDQVALGVMTESFAAPGTDPCFTESSTPQQTNGYDCGVYVMAIARVICQWYISGSKMNNELWFSSIDKHVDESVESTMRTEILNLIEHLRNQDNASS